MLRADGVVFTFIVKRQLAEGSASHHFDFLNMHLVQIFWMTIAAHFSEKDALLHPFFPLRNWNWAINFAVVSLHFSCFNFPLSLLVWCVLRLVVKYLSYGYYRGEWNAVRTLSSVTQELNICISLNKKRAWKDVSGLVSRLQFYDRP